MINRLVIGCVLVGLATALTCHYSCSSCVSSLYSQCLSCPSNPLTVIQNPTTTPSQYWPSVYPTGSCLDTLATSSNALGILLVIIVVGVCIAVRTKESFYLLLTLQTIGLFNLVEIAWVNPIGYVLQSLQHFMIMNTLGSGYKTDDYLLMASGNHRLHDYLKTSAAASNLILLAVFSLVAIALLIVICIVSLKRKKQAPIDEKQVIFEAMLDQSEYDQQPQKGGVAAQASSSRGDKDKEDENKQCCECWRNFSQQVLIKIAKVCLCFLFLMVQETVLVLVVGLVWGSPVSVGLIVVCIVYLHLLIFIMSYAYYYRIQYFIEKKSMYANFARKAVMPVLVVVPIRYQYLFFLFIGSFWLLQLVIDCYNGLYRKINRLAVYKCSETLVILLLTINYLVQRFGGGYAASRAAGIACTFMIALIFVLFAVQTGIGIKETYFSNKAKVEKKETQQITLENIQPNKHQMIEVLSLEDSNQDQASQAGKREIIEASPAKDQNAREDNLTKDDNSSINYNTQPSSFDKQKQDEEAEEMARQEAARKKRRKQILDKELRMRYGI